MPTSSAAAMRAPFSQHVTRERLTPRISASAYTFSAVVTGMAELGATVFCCVSSGGAERQVRGGARELEEERGAFALLGLQPDLPAHPFDELATDVEAKAGSADALDHVRIEPVELLEDPALLVGWDPHSLVGDAEEHAALGRVDSQLDPSPVRRVLDGVLHEVHEHLPRPVLVGSDERHVFGDVD